MFFGHEKVKFDGRNRLVVPSQFREDFDDGKVYIFCKEKEKIVRAYSQEGAKKIPDDKKQFVARLKMDEAGRITLPEKIWRVFKNCKRVAWKGWGQYCKILPAK